MQQTKCNHCGQAFDAQSPSCPYCDTPTPRQRDLEAAQTKRRFIRFLLILALVCLVLVFWLPRDL